MKRYLLFAGIAYYPSGGMDDFLGDFDYISEANEVLEKWKASENWPPYWFWSHIWDSEMNAKVNSNGE